MIFRVSIFGVSPAALKDSCPLEAILSAYRSLSLFYPTPLQLRRTRKRESGLKEKYPLINLRTTQQSLAHGKTAEKEREREKTDNRRTQAHSP